MIAPTTTFLTVERNLSINLSQIVWFRNEPDGTVTVYMNAPGPSGKNVYHITDGPAVAAFLKMVRV